MLCSGTFRRLTGAGLRGCMLLRTPTSPGRYRTASTPFGVNHLAQVAALASLDAEAELAERVDAVVAERGRVLAGLRDQGWEVPGHSQAANFVWLATGDRTTVRAADAAAHGGRRLRRPGPPGHRRSAGRERSGARGRGWH